MKLVSEYTIYKYTCSVTSKSYIGQTKNLKIRDLEHQRPSSGCPAFRNAIQKYGWSNFSREVLADNLTLTEANEQEEALISTHDTIVPNGYNISSGGLNHIVHPDTKRMISEKLKGRKCSPETIEKRRVKTKGVKKSQEFIDMVSRINTGKKRTEEQKQRMSLAAQGRQASDETKQKISAAKKGIPYPSHTCPHCNKIGSGNAMRRWHFDNCKFKGDASCV